MKNHSDSTKKLSETDIIKMLEFLIDNTRFAMFGWHVFQQNSNYGGTPPLREELL